MSKITQVLETQIISEWCMQLFAITYWILRKNYSKQFYLSFDDRLRNKEYGYNFGIYDLKLAFVIDIYESRLYIDNVKNLQSMPAVIIKGFNRTKQTRLSCLFFIDSRTIEKINFKN